MNEINLPWLNPDDENSTFPPAKSALKDPEGLVAAGGDLSPKRVLRAYHEGIFPWYEEDQPILWWSPDPRGIIYPKKFIAHKRLLRTLKKKNWQVTYNQSFVEVMQACAEPRQNSRGTWITHEMLRAYTLLHQLGHAHSLEVRNHQGDLIGGIYGVAIGSIFFGESMFHIRKDASKIAFHYLVEKCRQFDFSFIDSQVPNEHMKQMGCVEITRDSFLNKLKKSMTGSTVEGRWS